MSNKKRISVRELAEIACRGGDIDLRLRSNISALEGTRLHKLLQSRYGGESRAEVRLQIDAMVEDILFHVSGRADGVTETENGVIIEEIKSTMRPLEALQIDGAPAHWAQVMFYAHILSEQRGLPEVTARLTYVSGITNDVREFTRVFTSQELNDFFISALFKYVRWAKMESEWLEISRPSMAALPFPYGDFRGGQKVFARRVYTAARDGNDALIQAPTGIGKTIAALYGAVRAVGLRHAEKIFYLTAKETGRTSAVSAADALISAGCLAKTVVITARDKICDQPKRDCRPEVCPRAKGHFDRVDDAVFLALQNEDFLTGEVISRIAALYNVCPFEFSLDLALYADIIICDYNYVFDPAVYLRRFFAEDNENPEYILLCDEAHNLPDRSREMYSAEITKYVFDSAYAAAPKPGKASASALPAVKKLRAALIALRKHMDEINAEKIDLQRPGKLDGLIGSFIGSVNEYMLTDNEISEDLTEAYFSALGYERTCERYGDNYVTISKNVTITKSEQNDKSYKLYCADASAFLRERYEKSKAVIFFSATLYPFDFYKKTLGIRSNAKEVILPSPYPKENFTPLIATRISTRYNDRQFTIASVAEMIAVMSQKCRGNHIVYFPSYAYMLKAFSVFQNKFPGLYAAAQTPGQSSGERESFLAMFDAGEPVTAFCVLGGVFAEGIDLVGDKVVAVTVVGTGLPGLSPETEILKEKFGYDYAYVYPGFCKVMQAAGRLIRSETDCGAALLIDDRYTKPIYRSLFPEHWSEVRAVQNAEHLALLL